MIRKILTYCVLCLDIYLRRFHCQSAGVAEVGFIGNSAEVKPDKIVLSLLNMEYVPKEGVSASVANMNRGASWGSPLLALDLAIVLAAAYAESLEIDGM